MPSSLVPGLLAGPSPPRRQCQRLCGGQSSRISARQVASPPPRAPPPPPPPPPSSARHVAARATRRDLLLTGAALAPCACAVCLSRTQAGRDAYKRFFAGALATGMDAYEAEVAPRKAALLGDNLAALAAASAATTLTTTPSARRLAVLDLGVGAAPNAPYLAAVPGMGRVTGVDPNPFMFPYARAAAADAGFLVACGEAVEDEFADPRPTFTTVQATAEDLPFPDAAFDAVVCTLVLCSVGSVPATLAEAGRVLRPGGLFIFNEHVAADWGSAPGMRAAQTLFNPLQRALADGCHLTRDTEASVRGAAPGLVLREVERFIVPGMGFIGPHVAGVAVKA